jgi:hypothetical protein
MTSLGDMLGKGKMKKRVRMMDLKCAHAKKETAYVSMNLPSILHEV